jgi:hypothetical protein
MHTYTVADLICIADAISTELTKITALQRADNQMLHAYAELFAQQTAPPGGFHLHLWLAVRAEVSRRLGVQP